MALVVGNNNIGLLPVDIFLSDHLDDIGVIKPFSRDQTGAADKASNFLIDQVDKIVAIAPKIRVDRLKREVDGHLYG